MLANFPITLVLIAITAAQGVRTVQVVTVFPEG
jgi:hypothetical protein